MTTRNQFEKDRETSTRAQDDAASVPPISSKRELTDDEIAAVAGGTSGVGSKMSSSKM